MNPRTAAIVGAAWNAGNCCLIDETDTAKTVSINTPMVSGFSLPLRHATLIVPPAANANRPEHRPVA